MSVERALYGGHSESSGGPVRRVTINDLAAAKERGERWPMITCYDALTAGLFDESGIPSCSLVILRRTSSTDTTRHFRHRRDELIPLVRAVVRGSSRAMVIADLPFGRTKASPPRRLKRRRGS